MRPKNKAIKKRKKQILPLYVVKRRLKILDNICDDIRYLEQELSELDQLSGDAYEIRREELQQYWLALKTEKNLFEQSKD